MTETVESPQRCELRGAMCHLIGRGVQGGSEEGYIQAISRKRKEIDMATGKVKRLVQERGFGFISADDGREIFFHRSGVEGTTFEALQEGQRVSFEVEKGQKGPR